MALSSVDRLTGRTTSVRQGASWGSSSGDSLTSALYITWNTNVLLRAMRRTLAPVALQVEVTRSLREGLRTSSGSGSGLLAQVTLSPALSSQGLPSVVDAVKTVWPRNPFDPLPPGEAGVGGVLEYTLRDGTTRTVVDLPQVTSSSADLPMHFLVAIGTQ